MLKNQRGITLVALVITIVILIILATVAISFAFSSNGLIPSAEKAADDYKRDQEQTFTLINDATAYTANVEKKFTPAP